MAPPAVPLPRPPRRPSSPIPKPIPIPPVQPKPRPKLRLKIEDLSGAGARGFLSCPNAADVLGDAVNTVIEVLYPDEYGGTWPGTRSVTLILVSFAGVAYTRGTLLDNDHKEIHLSTEYVAGVGREGLVREITGVVVHEMVHCWQWDGCGTAPGGLVEGMADWVRLRAGLAPPHWKRRTSGKGGWDAGYQITAWFLDWLQDTYGPDTVPRMNRLLKGTKYEEESYWSRQCGFHKGVHELWDEYRRWLADKEDVRKEDEDEKDAADKEDERKAESGSERPGDEKICNHAKCHDAGAESELADKEDVRKEDEDEKDAADKENRRMAESAIERPGDEKSCNDAHAKSHDEGAESELDGGWTELSSGAFEPREPVSTTTLDATLTQQGQEVAEGRARV